MVATKDNRCVEDNRLAQSYRVHKVFWCLLVSVDRWNREF